MLGSCGPQKVATEHPGRMSGEYPCLGTLPAVMLPFPMRPLCLAARGWGGERQELWTYNVYIVGLPCSCSNSLHSLLLS